MASTLSAVRTGKRSLLDPRTKILLVIMVIAIMMSGGRILIAFMRWALTAVPFILLLSERKFRTAFIYAGVYTAAYISQILLMPIASGAVNFLLVALGIAARFMPGCSGASRMFPRPTIDLRVSIAPMSVVYSLLLTVLFAAIVDFVMYFRLRRISMAESLKSIE